VEIWRTGVEHFHTTGEPWEEIVAPDFVWDTSTAKMKARNHERAGARSGRR